MASLNSLAYNDMVGTKIRPLLDTVDKLRDVLEGEEIRLPTIAVIGSQSAGKSSILERISGVNLPHGGGMVTRVALVLQLQYKDIEGPEAWIKYGELKWEQIPENKIAERIVSITDQIAPDNKINVTDKIELRVISKNVPDLTLIDLPGICYNTDDGNGREVAENIKTLYRRYIEDDGCVILCVLPGSFFKIAPVKFKLEPP